MATTFIYALCEPGTRTIRYVGKTVNLRNRIRQHLRESSKKTNRLGNWLRRVVSAGKTPDLIELDKVAEGAWADAERFYIRLARDIGFDLVNATDGGEGITMTPEIRANIGAGNKGKKHSPEWCAAQSRARKGKKATSEQRAAQSLASLGSKNPFFGKRHTEECNAKQRKPKTEAERAKQVGFSLRGPEHQNFGSTSFPGFKNLQLYQSGENNPQFGRPRTPEERAAISAGLTGFKRSEETKARMSAAQKLRFQRGKEAK